ncbi:MAG: DUF4391 domain-containing protein [Christiangramia sp.]|uniref:DUF4391 domain-containing protein n=1 Tax=Christiangramia sp. TaxID=1931228 RepID=UPI003241F3D7
MDIFDLPERMRVGRVIPKNAFDSYTNSKQKQLFTDLIKRITWEYKISEATSNLTGKELKEIQIFYVELKEQKEIKEVLDIVDKAIPYPIIFLINWKNEYYYSTSTKHAHPTNDNISVIDWNFKTDWLNENEFSQVSINLNRSLDHVYKEFCLQLSEEKNAPNSSLEDIVEHQEKLNSLRNSIEQLDKKIRRSKQFNEKVELNQELNKKKRELENLRVKPQN